MYSNENNLQSALMSRAVCLRSHQARITERWQSANACGSTFRSCVCSVECGWYYFTLGPGQRSVLWANPCHSASLPAESVRNSSFSKPEPRQTDAGRRMIRCCLTSSQYGTCLQRWADSAVWTHSRTAQLLRRQDSAGCSLLFFACNGVMKIGGVRAFFFFQLFPCCTCALNILSPDQSHVSLLWFRCTWRCLSCFYGVLLNWSVVWTCLDGSGPAGPRW